jgi:osmotically-inducible protein OsmY
MRNDELIHAVKDELERDPDVDSAVVAVSADDGVVRLRGTVESLGEKHEAEKDAKRIHAAELVDNELQVKPLSDRKDAELRGQVLQALALDEVVPPTVDAKVKDGVVTLTGIVKGQDQLDAAKLAAANVAGDLEVIDQMTLTLEPNAHEVRGAIAAALKRNALARAKSLSIKTSHGTVTVKGKVRSWEERDAAIEAVRSLEGVRRVEDHITVES